MLTPTCSCPLGASRQHDLAQPALRLPIVRSHDEPGRGGTWRVGRKAKRAPTQDFLILKAMQRVPPNAMAINAPLVLEVCHLMLCYARLRGRVSPALTTTNEHHAVHSNRRETALCIEASAPPL